MCGEKDRLLQIFVPEPGSPPHVRGKGRRAIRALRVRGITPAYAGKSTRGTDAHKRPWDHPRVCGEKKRLGAEAAPEPGSPPHVRGKGCCYHPMIFVDGITPACAGKRNWRNLKMKPAKDHPRMCGEKSSISSSMLASMGSPPHVRGKGIPPSELVFPVGITPACAGKRLKRSRSTVPHAAIVPLFPSVCNKPAGSDGSPAGHDAPPFLPIENAAPASPAYNLRSL